MKSIEKLRDKIRLDVNNPWSDLKGDLLAMVDKIECEIAERYMELPVDADGVPIHVGDVVEFGENRNQGIVKALNEHMVIAMHVDDDYMNYAKYGLLWNADACSHVKPRTLEDVLTDFAEAIEERGTEWVDVSQTANAIRELMKVDE